VGFQFLPADVYYISELPSRVEIADIVQIAVLAFALSLLSTLYPAWRAARTEPAEALRYE
jgi:lipoprotein-releasing system permease protein